MAKGQVTEVNGVVIMVSQHVEIEQKACCNDSANWVHEYDENSVLGDAYYCGDCGKLTQVG